MRKTDSVIPGKIEDFNKYFIIILAYIILNALRLKISDEDIATLKNYMADPDKGWKANYDLHADIATQTKPVNTKLRICRLEATKFLQYIYRNISRKDMIVEDYQTFNIPIPDNSFHRKGLITNTPFVKITPIGGGVLQYEVRTSEKAETARMDPLASVIRVVGIILKPGEALPTDPSKCNLTFTSTKANFNHIFSIAEAGNRFACYVQYVNQSDESKNGPISELHVCIIVG